MARVLLRHDLSELHAEKDAELQAMLGRHGDEISHPAVVALKDEVLALEAEIDESMVSFRFRALSARDWRVLMAGHPPTKAQKTTNEQVAFNGDTFWPAAIAACLVDPALSLDEVAELESTLLTSDQWESLVATCLTVNRAGDPGKSWAAGLIHRTSGASATTAVNGVSPAVSSSVG